jgi:hypothetical protein
MKLYVSYFDVPEIRQLPPEERDRLHRKHRLKIFRHWRGWLGMASFMASWKFGEKLIDALSALCGAKWHGVIVVAVVVIVGGLSGFISGAITTPALVHYMLKDHERSNP